MRMKKQVVIGIFFIVLMLGSTIAYSIMSAIRQPEASGGTSLPDTNIIDYELTARQEELLLQNGKVIAKFTYSINCMECLQQKSYLEYFTRQYSDQMFLMELTGNVTAQNSTLTVNSLRGYETLTNITTENVLDVFCELMLRPPVECALRKM
ncbi:MAG: hypothetical protein QW112_04065 [Candidatus Micrarchaeia archaeon]